MSFIQSSRAGDAAARLSGRGAERSSLPKHVLIGYWHNWQASPAAFIPAQFSANIGST